VYHLVDERGIHELERNFKTEPTKTVEFSFRYGAFNWHQLTIKDLKFDLKHTKELAAIDKILIVTNFKACQSIIRSRCL
jgi:hypothetical protein